jgi:hypothetical protein
MIISVVVLMVATTYHCSAQPSIRFSAKGTASVFRVSAPWRHVIFIKHAERFSQCGQHI